MNLTSIQAKAAPLLAYTSALHAEQAKRIKTHTGYSTQLHPSVAVYYELGVRQRGKLRMNELVRLLSA